MDLEGILNVSPGIQIERPIILREDGAGYDPDYISEPLNPIEWACLEMLDIPNRVCCPIFILDTQIPKYCIWSLCGSTTVFFGVQIAHGCYVQLRPGILFAKNPAQNILGILLHPKRTVLELIENYQTEISPRINEQLGVERKCIYTPSCSEYARQAIETYGLIKGGILSVGRLSRCTHHHPGGYDPIPALL